DYGPQFFSGSLVFSSSANNIPSKYPKSLRSELWLSRHSGALDAAHLNRDWSEPDTLGVRPMKGLALDLNEGAMAVVPEQHKAIFAAERILNDSTKEVSPLMDLYEVPIDSATLRPSGEPMSIDAVNDPNAWDSQPTLSPDGKTLFFVSDRPL